MRLYQAHLDIREGGGNVMPMINTLALLLVGLMLAAGVLNMVMDINWHRSGLNGLCRSLICLCFMGIICLIGTAQVVNGKSTMWTAILASLVFVSIFVPKFLDSVGEILDERSEYHPWLFKKFPKLFRSI